MPDTHLAPRGPRPGNPRASLLVPPVLDREGGAVLCTLLLTAAALCVHGVLPW